MSRQMPHTVKKTSIDGVFIIERPIYSDDRGFMHEAYRMDDLEKVSGVKFEPVQWSHAMSMPRVIRAIHTEKWNKLVYPITGILYAPIVDVRPDSKTFLKVEEIVIDNTKKDSPRQSIFLPPGMGNSICAMGSEPLHYLYLIDKYWDDSKAQGIDMYDPDINIKWPIKNPIISGRDRKNSTLRELYPEKFKNK